MKNFPKTLVALPKVQAGAPWPSFSLSIEHRKAISDGKMPQVNLDITGKVISTPLDGVRPTVRRYLAKPSTSTPSP